MGDLLSLRRADTRFVLPSWPRRAVVLGGLAAWAAGLDAAGVEVVTAGSVADLVVTPPALARDASSLGIPSVLVTGAVRGLPGLATRRYLTLPRVESPRFVIDPKQQHAAAYAGSLLPRYAAVARRVLGGSVARDALAAGIGPGVTVGARTPGRPALLTAATDFGALGRGEWFLALGAGGVRRRAVFYLFDGAGPAQVVKVARVPGDHAAFDRDERGLALALAAGHVVAGKAPRLVGRGEACGLPASVETALPGGPFRADLAERVVDWLRAVARATVVRGEAGPRVFRHGDVFPGNVVAHGGDFALVDWEHAEREGLPLADLLFFAAHLAGDPVAAFTAGTYSPWLRDAAGDLGLSGDDVRAIAKQAWQQHGDRARTARLAREKATGEPVEPYLAERVADVWATHPGLGDTWRPW